MKKGLTSPFSLITKLSGDQKIIFSLLTHHRIWKRALTEKNMCHETCQNHSDRARLHSNGLTKQSYDLTPALSNPISSHRVKNLNKQELELL